MTTAFTDIVEGFSILQAMEQVEVCEPDVWTLYKVINAPNMKLALFHSHLPTLVNVVMYKVVCCGMAKLGQWKLVDISSLNELSECVRQLVLEIHTDTLHERAVLQKGLLDAKLRDCYLNQ